MMHKDVEVADLDISPESGSVGRILLVRQPEHMPVGTCIKGHVDGTRLKQWWKNRSIPASRSGIGHLLESLGIDDTLLLLTNSMGLSLSDHYWIKKADCNVTWFDVNYFDNDFSEDIGNLLFGNTVDPGSIDLSSPDNTSDGILRKKWKIIDGRRFLLKGGEPPSMQEPYNEVMASVLMDALGSPMWITVSSKQEAWCTAHARILWIRGPSSSAPMQSSIPGSVGTISDCTIITSAAVPTWVWMPCHPWT